MRGARRQWLGSGEHPGGRGRAGTALHAGGGPGAGRGAAGGEGRPRELPRSGRRRLAPTRCPTLDTRALTVPVTSPHCSAARVNSTGSGWGQPRGQGDHPATGGSSVLGVCRPPSRPHCPGPPDPRWGTPVLRRIPAVPWAVHTLLKPADFSQVTSLSLGSRAFPFAWENMAFDTRSVQGHFHTPKRPALGTSPRAIPMATHHIESP